MNFDIDTLDTFDSLEAFYNYTLDNHCKCGISCPSPLTTIISTKSLLLPLTNNLPKVNGDCSLISTLDINPNENYLDTIKKIIASFEKFGYITKTSNSKRSEGKKNKKEVKSAERSNFDLTEALNMGPENETTDSNVDSNSEKYLMLVGRAGSPAQKQLLLRWTTIKNLDTSLLTRMWFFRKAIVDCCIKFILTELKTLDVYTDAEIDSIKIFAVGSVKLTSDYDLTVYSSPTLSVYIIRRFGQIIQDLFNETPDIIFDTNVYGKGFVEFKDITPEMNDHGYILGECGEKKFYYLRDDPIYYDSQLMWALTKFIQGTKFALGEDIYKQVSFFYKNNLRELYTGHQHLDHAEYMLEYLSNKQFDYSGLLGLSDYILKSKYTDSKILKMTDYISVTNFFGMETYYTKGAFMDVVIMNQTCKNEKLMNVKLEIIDYLVSIIENTGFFFLHNEKDKYLLRILGSLNKIIDQTSTFIGSGKLSSKIPKIIKTELDLLLKKVKFFNKDADRICSGVIQLEITKYCIKPEIYQFLLQNVFKLLKWYLSGTTGSGKIPSKITVFIPIINLELTNVALDDHLKEIEDVVHDVVPRRMSLNPETRARKLKNRISTPINIPPILTDDLSNL